MRLPKFWPETAGLNEALVTFCIIVSMAGWIAWAWLAESLWLAVAGVILGPVLGFVVGVALVLFLNSYCGRGDP
jgi:hypothetical protein